MDDSTYQQLKATIKRLTKIDLDLYKPQQMRRRLDGYVATRQEGGEDFSVTISRDKVALLALRDFITINVTEFFRDVDQFESLKTKVLPAILAKTPRLNIWSAGCSIGAEPYTVAMILNELTPGVRHRILATDLDERSLLKAKAGGPYSEVDLKSVSKALLLKYLTPDSNAWKMSNDLRGRIEFKQHNMLTDRFETGFDLVLCRNVVIYFSDETKRMLDKQFQASLKPDGWLFIGGSETMLSAKELGYERRHSCFYQKVPLDAEAQRTNRAARTLRAS